MSTIIEKVRDAFTPDVDTRIADIEAKRITAQDGLSRAREAHATASLNVHSTDAPKNAASVLATTTRNLDAAYAAVADLDAALTAANARKDREEAEQASARERARQEAREAAFAIVHAKGAKLAVDLDVLVKSGNELADAIEAMKGTFDSSEVAEHYGRALTSFSPCLAYRLRRLGFKAPLLMDDDRAAWVQYLPGAEQVLKTKPAKVAA